jgi:uncharacterized protein (TIGR04255 family)
MAALRTYLTHAPIVEAVIDFRVLRRPNVAPDEFRNLSEQLGAGYGQPRPVRALEARFGVHEGELIEPRSVQSPMGWIYRADAALAQFRIDGFTFNKLEPYTTWEQVFGEANRLWAIYVQIARPNEVSRVAVRYVNRLRLPGPAELGQYLEAPPVLPPPIPQAIREFLSRVVVGDDARQASAILTQALEASLDPTVIPLLLDIDAFKDLVAVQPNDGGIPAIFEQLRQLKNAIFFASITEMTAEMYA